ncbi:MAG: thiamine pyrophosphate-binding protein [Candidatus Competibacteraceae bacterium]
MKASDYISQFLSEQGVTCIFELSGGMITHMLDSIYCLGKVRIVSMHHEQGAAFAADAMGRMTGIPGVALATSGPGATNLLTGIGSCYFDSSPAVFITGQVNRNEQKGDRPIRQLGFQETDIVSMAKPITKGAWLINDPAELPGRLHEAFELALSGRPGPVLLDIPMDVQRADITVPPTLRAEPRQLGDPAEVRAFMQRLLDALQTSQRPLILVGGGIRAAGMGEALREFAVKSGIPVVNSLMAVDALPFDSPLRVGMIGSYGNRWANLSIGASDLLIVLGSRLDIRQTGALTEEFKGQRQVFHVDAESGEMNNRVTGCHTLQTDLRTFFTYALDAFDEQKTMYTEWLDEIHKLRIQYPDTAELHNIPGINPNILMHRLSAVSQDAGAYVVDVGQHQMWAAQSLDLTSDQRFLTSGGMGSMGFALPAAIGTALATAPRPVVMIAGDGGFQCNIQELQTVARNKLPLKIVVINNRTHGMVRQFQESYFEARYQSTLWGYNTPDFARVAEAYTIAGRTITDMNEIDQGLTWLWQEPAKPALLQVMVDTYANSYPKIAFGQPITCMEPDFQPLDMEGT